MNDTKINIEYVKLADLIFADYNPRKWDDLAKAKLTKSIKEFGFVDPVIVNMAPERKNVIIGGHFRATIAKELGIDVVPVVYIYVPEIEKEKELNLRLNRNSGEWDLNLLKSFDEVFLRDVGFDDATLKMIFDSMDNGWDNLREDKESLFEQMTFTLTHTQAEIVKDALSKAIELGPFPDTGNENKNSNALERICELYGK